MDKAQIDAWLERYVEAWESNDREQITPLFSDDARYRYHPHEEPIVGGEAVAAAWLDDPDEPGSWRARYETIAVDGDLAVATGQSFYLEPDGSEKAVYDNCFVMRFAGDGRCSDFVEYYVKRPS